MCRSRPALALLLLAPVLGEGLSSATPPLELVLPWNLVLFVALYGCGALVCRELARRRGLGVVGLCLLAAAYAVYEEALVDRFWFTSSYWHDTGVDDYSAVWQVNVLLAAHLTVFHVAVSIGSSIVVVERLVPGRRSEPWVGRGSLAAAVVALLVIPPLLFGEYHLRAWPQLLAALALVVVLVGLALATPGLRSRPGAPAVRRTPRAAGVIAFVCTAAHFVATYSVGPAGLPWPLGVLVALLPVAVGVLVLRRADPVPVVSGVLTFFGLLCVVIGLGGRYDTSLLGLGALVGLVSWRRRAGRTDP